jgi:hypothetical protein
MQANKVPVDIFIALEKAIKNNNTKQALRLVEMIKHRVIIGEDNE